MSLASCDGATRKSSNLGVVTTSTAVTSWPWLSLRPGRVQRTYISTGFERHTAPRQHACLCQPGKRQTLCPAASLPPPQPVAAPCCVSPLLAIDEPANVPQPSIIWVSARSSTRSELPTSPASGQRQSIICRAAKSTASSSDFTCALCGQKIPAAKRNEDALQQHLEKGCAHYRRLPDEQQRTACRQWHLRELQHWRSAMLSGKHYVRTRVPDFFASGAVPGTNTFAGAGTAGGFSSEGGTLAPPPAAQPSRLRQSAAPAAVARRDPNVLAPPTDSIGAISAPSREPWTLRFEAGAAATTARIAATGITQPVTGSPPRPQRQSQPRPLQAPSPQRPPQQYPAAAAGAATTGRPAPPPPMPRRGTFNTPMPGRHQTGSPNAPSSPPSPALPPSTRTSPSPPLSPTNTSSSGFILSHVPPSPSSSPPYPTPEFFPSTTHTSSPALPSRPTSSPSSPSTTPSPSSATWPPPRQRSLPPPPSHASPPVTDPASSAHPASPQAIPGPPAPSFPTPNPGRLHPAEAAHLDDGRPAGYQPPPQAQLTAATAAAGVAAGFGAAAESQQSSVRIASEEELEKQLLQLRGLAQPSGKEFRPPAFRPHQWEGFKQEDPYFSSLVPAALSWLRDTRCVTEQVIRANRIYCERMLVRGPGGQKTWSLAVAFPFFKNGKLVNVKYRLFDPEAPEPFARKDFRMSRKGELVVFGYDDIRSGGYRDVIIVEGEMDKLALNTAGFWNVVSVPNGAPPATASHDAPILQQQFADPGEMETASSRSLRHYAYMDSLLGLFPDLARCRFTLATDADSAGVALRRELMRRLGRERCWELVSHRQLQHQHHHPVESLPEDQAVRSGAAAAAGSGSEEGGGEGAGEGAGKGKGGATRCTGFRKDANEVLMRDGVAQLMAVMESAQPAKVAGLVTFKEFEIEISRYFQLRDPLQLGVSTGWHSLDSLYRVAPGELTLVTGVPNSGKSEWLDALLVNLAENHGWSFALCSMEKGPLVHCRALLEKRMRRPFQPYTRSGYSLPGMPLEDMLSGFNWLSEHFILIRYEQEDDVGSPTIDWVLDKARMAVMRYGIRGLVIDPYNELDNSRPSQQTETDYIRGLLTKVRKFARDTECHVWFVAHPRQQYGDKNISPGLYDISGSAHWFNKTDNGVVVHRRYEEGKDASGRRYRYSLPQVDIKLQKVRNKEVGSQGEAYLLYDKPTGRYVDPAELTALTKVEAAAGGGGGGGGVAGWQVPSASGGGLDRVEARNKALGYVPHFDYGLPQLPANIDVRRSIPTTTSTEYGSPTPTGIPASIPHSYSPSSPPPSTSPPTTSSTTTPPPTPRPPQQPGTFSPSPPSHVTSTSTKTAKLPPESKSTSKVKTPGPKELQGQRLRQSTTPSGPAAAAAAVTMARESGSARLGPQPYSSMLGGRSNGSNPLVIQEGVDDWDEDEEEEEEKEWGGRGSGWRGGVGGSDDEGILEVQADGTEVPKRPEEGLGSISRGIMENERGGE